MPKVLPKPTAKALLQELKQQGNPAIAEHSQSFFKTGKGEYGEGDLFIGIRVPKVRILAKRNKNISLAETLKLLKSPYHEARLLAAILLTQSFENGDAPTQESIYEAYLDHTDFINNWDIVDASSHKIVGPWLEKRSRRKLYQLARSPSLWERRIAIIATFHFIRQDDFETTLEIAEILLNDPEELIHKAVGWMLRELGKRSPEREESFLEKHAANMPRTMLRYAIEKFPEAKRKAYLANEQRKT